MRPVPDLRILLAKKLTCNVVIFCFRVVLRVVEDLADGEDFPINTKTTLRLRQPLRNTIINDNYLLRLWVFQNIYPY